MSAPWKSISRVGDLGKYPIILAALYIILMGCMLFKENIRAYFVGKLPWLPKDWGLLNTIGNYLLIFLGVFIVGTALWAFLSDPEKRRLD